MATARKATRAAKTTEQAVAAVKEITPKTATDKLSAAKLAIADELAKVDAAVVSAVQTRDNLRIEISELQNQIKDLHEIDVSAETLDELKAELEAFQISMEEEKDRALADHNELITNREKAWKQEAAEHAYLLAQRDKKDDDAFAFMQSQRKREEDLRINALTARELKAADLEAQIAAMPGKIDEAVKAQVASTTAAIKQNYEHAATVERMSLDAKNKLLEQQNTSLSNQVAKHDQSRIEAVAVAEKARQELNALAQAAVNASSGREALKAVQEAQPNTTTPAGRGR